MRELIHRIGEIEEGEIENEAELEENKVDQIRKEVKKTRKNQNEGTNLRMKWRETNQTNKKWR